MISSLRRNIAIIAHVDHGKTTLVDKLLDAKSDRVMDSNALESERGITILAKCTSIVWQSKDTEYNINIIDSPGHRDFGGEVERALAMVDGAVLLVDAAEGVEQQTKFVTRKALNLGIPIIVVINKVDRPGSEPEERMIEVIDYLETAGLKGEIPVLYASGRQGWATYDLQEALSGKAVGMAPLLDTVIQHIPAPKLQFTDQEARFSVRMIDSDKHLGRILIGRVESGVISTGQTLHVKNANGNVESAKVSKIMQRQGMKSLVIDTAEHGDIVSIAGFSNATVGDSVLSNKDLTPLLIPSIDPPTLSMTLTANTSPFLGRDGKKLTSQLIQERILKEAESDVSLQVSISGSHVTVAGRGEMHLGVLIENLRRENFELTVFPPEVRIIDNKEPWERLVLEMDLEHMGTVVSELNSRHAQIQDTAERNDGNRMRIECIVSAKNILGYRSKYLADTQGSGIWGQSFEEYRDMAPRIQHKRNGVLVSTTNGTITSYALDKLSDRGEMFIEPGIEVYEGMIIGENNKDNDLDVNPVHAKKLTNMRASGTDETIRLSPPRKLSLEDALLYIQADECIEVTPLNIRLRKKGLTQQDRKRFAKS